MTAQGADYKNNGAKTKQS